MPVRIFKTDTNGNTGAWVALDSTFNSNVSLQLQNLSGATCLVASNSSPSASWQLTSGAAPLEFRGNPAEVFVRAEGAASLTIKVLADW